MRRGDFVRVGEQVGVVTHLAGEGAVPEEHVAVWYGEVADREPQVRTVPAEYCVRVDEVFCYH